jgi:hypothetical protein
MNLTRLAALSLLAAVTASSLAAAPFDYKLRATLDEEAAQ